MSGKRLNNIFMIVAAAVIAFGAGVFFSDDIYARIAVNATALDKDQSQRYSEILEKISELDSVLDTYYLEADNIDPDEMMDTLYKGYISGLDERYTAYYTPEEYEQLMNDSQGVYVGIGVTVTTDQETGNMVIVTVTEDGPGEAAGLLEGDTIISIEGESVQDMDLDTAVSKIQGEEGTEVTIGVYRESTGETLEKTMTRRKMDAQTVAYSMLKDNIGYIQITAFDEVTVEQFDNAVSDLQSQNIRGLIVDVRGNPGGNVDSVCSILDRLLPEGLLVYTIDKNGSKEEEYADNEEVLDIPMAVLVNGDSASASEIFAAALQDYDWAEIVGEQTYGKGIVQYIIPLSDGSAVKLTSAKYYTPNGECIHGIGVTPDVKVAADENSASDTQLEAAVSEVEKMLQSD
ncbi:MAG TPA: S41 family peptidase [Candidatus Scybalocola faecipullorum]|nr:S41 family peptidase [Candidatus Scybalocola faecipullorum]